jgi:predicted amidophosphoribosyltransferase
MFFPDTCFSCGAFAKIHVGLCPICLPAILNPTHVIERPAYFWMVDWTNRRQAWMSHWARHFKGNLPQKWRSLAEMTAEALCTQGQFKKIGMGSSLVIVDPSQKKDHSYWYAHHLAEMLSAQHLPFFFLASAEDQQKNLGPLMRQISSSNYEIRDPEVWIRHRTQPKTHWLFVDDIVTTGATSQGAFHLLQRPQSFLVVSWLKRHLEKIS